MTPATPTPTETAPTPTDTAPPPTATVTLAAGEATAEVYPGHGCLIGSLRISTIELLWRDGQPRLLQPTASRGDASATEFDEGILIGGWFPMFPSAGLPDTATQQHGWAPRVSWSVRHRTSHTVTAIANGPFLHGGDALLERTISLTRTSLTARTRITNQGTRSGSFTFGEHPCFARSAFAGSALEVNDRRLSDVPASPDSRSQHHQAEGNQAVMTTVTGAHRLRLHDTLGTLPFWLLWENYRSEELRRADTFAWEPCTSPGTGIEDARRAGAILELAPQASASFELSCHWSCVVDNKHLESVQ